MKQFLRSLGLLSLTLILSARAQETRPAYSQSLSVDGGLYSLSGASGGASGFGLLNFEYLKVFSDRWAAMASYAHILDRPSNVSSSVNGFDILGKWCWKLCRPFKKEDDPTNATYYPRWGQAVFFGFSQRYFQLQSQTIAFSGLKVGYELARFTRSPFSPYGRVSMARMVNGESELNVMAFTVGARWWF